VGLPPGERSLWMEQLEPVDALPSLDGDHRVDVAIVGGGFTGLWTAYYLKSLAPHLSLAVLEARVCGYGASGRNGGWLMSSLCDEVPLLASLPPGPRAEARAAILSILPEVERVLALEGIDCHYRRGGGIYAAARYPEQERWQREILRELIEVGFSEADYRWLDSRELAGRLAIRDPMGAIYTPHVARIQPAALVRGLLVAVRRLGVEVFENTSVTGVDGDAVLTATGRVTAGTRVLAMEGFAHAFPDYRRRVLPVQSRIIATESLDESRWAQLGLQRCEVFADASPLITYGQRSADNRMVFGSRGTYRFGAHPQSDFAADSTAFETIHRTLLDCFPQLQGAAITHRWGGTLGISRKTGPHAIYDPVSGLATAGGYSGEGVGGANLMILERQSDLVSMPWAHRAPIRKALRRWEPEPLRWLGYKAVTLGQAWQEAVCRRGAPSWQRSLVDGFYRVTNRLHG
jgi:glycine/D-amino acid oxidase-like deaminating enzyme